ncbi:hypothetical protein BDR26DRAFT_868920 [Obelidium mucronatum]|nr:hypothetical protein BDR26DRAFT_868920 [Obelidium mucronatum]
MPHVTTLSHSDLMQPSSNPVTAPISLKGPGGVDLLNEVGSGNTGFSNQRYESRTSTGSRTDTCTTPETTSHIRKYKSNATGPSAAYPILIADDTQFDTQINPRHFHSHNYKLEQDQPPSSPEPCPSSSSSSYSHFRTVSSEFSESYNLKSHYFLHSNLRPYKCLQCSADFVRQRDVERHKKTVHAETKDFSCAFCGNGFARRDSLQRHVRICGSTKKRGGVVSR